MIISITPSDYNELKSIWFESFEKGDEKYAESFLLYHTPHSGLAYRANGRIVSMFFLIPCYWNEMTGYYVFACATLPQFREKGYMRALLDAAFEKARNENMFGLILIPSSPSLFGFYEKYGFKNFSQIAELDFERKDGTSDEFDFVKSSDSVLIANLRNRFYEQKTAVHFDLSHIHHIQNFIVNEYGATLVFENDKKKGYAFCIEDKQNETVIVEEWALISDNFHEDIIPFFNGICRYFNQTKLLVRSKSGLRMGSERWFSMARLCVKKSIQEHAYFNLGMD
jgi:predicted acetyltransferase